MREAVGVAYPCHRVAGSTFPGFPEWAAVLRQRMDKHFPEANNNRLSSETKTASRRYYTLRRRGRAARVASVRGKMGSSVGTGLRR